MFHVMWTVRASSCIYRMCKVAGTGNKDTWRSQAGVPCWSKKVPLTAKCLHFARHTCIKMIGLDTCMRDQVVWHDVSVAATQASIRFLVVEIVSLSWFSCPDGWSPLGTINTMTLTRWDNNLANKCHNHRKWNSYSSRDCVRVLGR
jgi:hypothetical protein